jgi:predicted nucleotidyltransferase
MDRVDRLELRLAADLCAATRALAEARIPYAVIGANALILQGIALPRTTRDLDLVVVVEGGLDSLRSVLEAKGLRSTRISHRFVAGAGTEVDILPLSPQPGTMIEFPDGERISSVGLPETVRYAEDVESGECTIRVARLPILVAIKVHAATVRTGDRDLPDALAVMEQFEAHGTRRFELDYVAAPELVWETAGAFLLGCDANSMLDDMTRGRVEQAIQTLLDDPRMSADHSWGQERAPLLRAFRLGLATRLSNEDV